MKQLIPVKSNNNEIINAIGFPDFDAGRIFTIDSTTPFFLPVPDGAKFAVFQFNPGEVVYVWTIVPFVIPPLGQPAENGNAQINPGIRALNGEDGLWFLGLVQQTVIVNFYNG